MTWPAEAGDELRGNGDEWAARKRGGAGEGRTDRAGAGRRRGRPEARATASARPATGDESEGLLDVEQAAQRLGVKVSLVRRLILERRIPFVKVAKYVRFDPADLDAWVEEAKVPVTPARHHGGPWSKGGGR